MSTVSVELGKLIVGAAGTGLVTLFFFLIRSYFNRMLTDISKLTGSVETMRRDLHDTREEMIVARSEIKALWRTVDAPRRASDSGD